MRSAAKPAGRPVCHWRGLRGSGENGVLVCGICRRSWADQDLCNRQSASLTVHATRVRVGSDADRDPAVTSPAPGRVSWPSTFVPTTANCWRQRYNLPVEGYVAACALTFGIYAPDPRTVPQHRGRQVPPAEPPFSSRWGMPTAQCTSAEVEVERGTDPEPRHGATLRRHGSGPPSAAIFGL